MDEHEVKNVITVSFNFVPDTAHGKITNDLEPWEQTGPLSHITRTIVML